MRYLLVFSAFFMTIVINDSDNVLVRLGFDTNYFLAALISVIVALLIATKPFLLSIIILALSLIANMPADFILNLGLDRDYFWALMVSMILTPIVINLL